MTAVAELIAQREQINVEIRALEKKAHYLALKEINKIMVDSNITLSDISGLVSGKKESTHKTSGTKVSAKYIDKTTGSTWSGRGIKPKWLSQKISEGRKAEEFLIAHA